MARGTDPGCDTALRPRGRARRGPRGAQVALTRGKETTRTVHVGARVGRHVAEGSQVEGPLV